MPTNTPYYNLVTYNSTTDGSEYFLQFRTDVAGVSDSNMTKIDTALYGLQNQITLKYSGATYITATAVASNIYSVNNVSTISNYYDGLAIVLLVDVTNTGTCTLDINTLGSRNLSK